MSPFKTFLFAGNLRGVLIVKHVPLLRKDDLTREKLEIIVKDCVPPGLLTAKRRSLPATRRYQPDGLIAHTISLA